MSPEKASKPAETAATAETVPTLTFHWRAIRAIPELGLAAGEEVQHVLTPGDALPVSPERLQALTGSGALEELQPHSADEVSRFLDATAAAILARMTATDP